VKFFTIFIIFAIVLGAYWYMDRAGFENNIKTPVVNTWNKFVHPSNTEDTNKTAFVPANETGRASNPQSLGKPTTTFNCKTDAECETAFPLYSKTIICNVVTGECENP
jgi:hypothetical protein